MASLGEPVRLERGKQEKSNWKYIVPCELGEVNQPFIILRVRLSGLGCSDWQPSQLAILA